MRKSIENIFRTAVLLLTLQSAWGFSLSGPVGNKDDQWQTITIGYGWFDSVAPKDLFEEYRPVVPVEYYASDASFISYYGSAGLTNIDAAFGLLNGVMCGLTNTPVFLFSPTNGVTMSANGLTGGTAFTLTASNSLDSYSPNLSEFPQSAQQHNPTAGTLDLMDMKSFVLQKAVLEMGLADPSRYVWTLHDRHFAPGIQNPICPGDEEYLVVQRNFDVTQDYPYSPYINGALYNFGIIENCGNNPNVPWSAIITNAPADLFASGFTAVTTGGLLGGGFGNGLRTGDFYYGLTQDDAMGLKYLLSTNNVNWENTAPSGGTLLLTNVQPPQTLTTLPISLLFSQAVTNDPNTLLTNYPGLVILSVITNIAPQITTNAAPYFTNQSVLPVFSNTVSGGLAQVTHPTNIYYFTNQPGPTVINYDISASFTQISTLDFAVFSDLTKTNPPATMQALYPALQILRATTSPAFTTNITYVTYLTNKVGSPYGSAPILVTKAVATNYLFVTNWLYTFGNVFTNHYYTNRYITVQTVTTKNAVGAPFGTPPTITTKTTTYKTNMVSGDFFLIPTNWCGFDLQLAFPLSNPPYTYGSTNVSIYTNYQSGSNLYGVTNIVYDRYTNYNYAVYPGICEPALVLGTNYETNIVTTYQYYFGGIVTNHFNANSFSVVTTTNVGPCPGGSPDLLCTNTSIVTNVLNQPTGDFYVVPPAWCGYTVLSSLLTNVTLVTNVVVSTNSAGVADIGQFFSQTTITAQTNVTLLVQPSFCSQAAPVTNLRRGVGRVQFIRANYDSLLGQFFQALTNTYSMVVITNGQPVTEYYQRVATRPDFLFQGADLTAPPNIPNNTVSAPNFDQSAITTALAGPGTIVPGTTIVFNENRNNLFLNGSLNNYNYPTNGFLNQDTQSGFAAWGSFDGSTNYPVVYPSGASITNLMNQLVIQVTPSAMPDGTNGAAYSITFTATGGTPPYTWAAPNFSTLVPGLAFDAPTATVSGTPIAAGVFNFTLQLTDSANRTVSLNYQITIH